MIRLDRWLDEIGFAPGAAVTLHPLTTGRSNITYVLERGGQRAVLRRPANVALARADEGMRREFTLLRALDGSDVPHPSPIAFGEATDLFGCHFYVMSFIDGFAPSEPLPDEWAYPEARRSLSLSAVEAMAALHRVDWRARGLADLGRVEGFHDRQRSRWLKQYDSYPLHLLDGIEAVGDWLHRHRPANWSPTSMHGDVNGGNMLASCTHPPRINALLDWETATIGDPLLDVAGFLNAWVDRRTGNGWPDRRELLAHYTALSGRDTGDLRYYDVLYRFKFAVLTEGIYQRSLSDSTRATADDLHAYATNQIAACTAAIAQ